MSGTARNRGWLAVVVLVAAYAVSMLDRQVVSLLVDSLKQHLHVTDTQIGILQGPAFGIFYAILGLPLGWLADRCNRVHLICAAVTLWSAMTIACGLAQDFTGLLLARMGVGVGEAALVPAAVSLLADLFARSQRALPLSVFTSGVSVGAGLSLTLGGVFIAFAGHGVAQLPLLGPWLAGQQSWQIVFILAGLCGLPVAALVLMLRDPRAIASVRVQPAQATTAMAWRHLTAQRRFFVPMLASMGALYILTNAVSAWTPTLFVRQFGWSPADVGRVLGFTIMPCALLGNWTSGLLTSALARRGLPDAALRTMLIGTSMMVPAAIAMPLLTWAAGALTIVTLLYFGMALTFGIATAAFVEVTPPRLRGQIVALYLLIGNLFGLGLGPPTVGALIDTGLGRADGVGGALALVCASAGLPAAWLLLRARRAFAPAVASASAVSQR